VVARRSPCLDQAREACQARAVPAGGVNGMSAVFLQPQAQALVLRAPDSAPTGKRQVALRVVEVGGGALNESDEAGSPPLKEDALRAAARLVLRRAHATRWTCCGGSDSRRRRTC